MPAVGPRAHERCFSAARGADCCAAGPLFLPDVVNAVWQATLIAWWFAEADQFAERPLATERTRINDVTIAPLAM